MSVLPFRALASDLIQRATLAMSAGLSFGGKRDLYAALGYEKKLEAKHYRGRYERGGLAKRIVEALPSATWRGGVELIEDEDPESTTDFEEAWDRLDERLQIGATLKRLDILAGLGHYAVLLIGAPGELETPLPNSLTEDQILYLTPFSEEDADVEKLIDDSQDPRFGLPALYKIKRIGGATSSAKKERKVHWSRVIHVADGALDDPIFGQPRLQAVWNYLDDLDKVVGGGSEAFWLRVHQGFHFNLDKELDSLSEPEKDKLKEAADELAHGFRRTLATRGMELTVLGSDVSRFNDQVDSLVTLIAGTTSIPKRILVGSERGELASTQDRTEWGERVAERREGFAGPSLVRPLPDLLIERGALPEPEEKYVVRWPEIQKLDEIQKATVATAWAGLNSISGEVVVLGSEIRDRVLGLEPLDEDQILEAQALLLPPELPPVDETVVSDQPPSPVDEDEPVAAQRATRKPKAYRRTHLIADAHRKRFVQVLVQAAVSGRKAISLDVLEAAFSEESLVQVENAVETGLSAFGTILQERFPDRILDVVAAAGASAARASRRAGRIAAKAKPPFKLNFDRTNPRAMEWAATRSASLVTSVNTETRGAIRGVIQSAFAEKIAPREAARLIQPLVGLTQRDAGAVLNLRARLLTSLGKVVFAGSRRIEVPESVTSEFLDKQTGAYSDRLLAGRALNIARTETIAASVEGQRELWLQARDQGLLTGRELRVWITTADDRIDEDCIAMDGQLRGLEEEFETPDGARVMGPPLHPQCRCAVGISELREKPS